MPEIARFKPCRVWTPPLLATAAKSVFPQKKLAVKSADLRGEVLFEKQCGVWIAAKVPRFILWTRGLVASEFKIVIENEGFSWEWL